MSERTQTALIWWSLVFMNIYGASWIFLIGLLPLPPATLTAQEVAAFYMANSAKIRLGAAICSWTSAFAVPLTVVISIQLSRLEKGVPIWSVMQLIGGVMTSIFVVFPPILWGIAAFTPDRPAEITLLIHQTASIIFVTTTQYFIFQIVAIVVVSLTQKADHTSPFPRWFGYLSIWIAFLTEVAVAGYLTKTGPFAWNGLFVFWIPLVAASAWMVTLAVMMLRALKRQHAHAIA